MPVHSWARVVPVPLIIAFTVWFVITGLWIGVIGYSATPFYDQWSWLLPDELLRGLFAQHNEHRIVISRLIFFADDYLAGGAGIISTIAIYVFMVLHCALLFFLLRKAFDLRGVIQQSLLSLAIAAFFFTGFQFENFVSGFQNQFTGVFLFASASLAALAHYAARAGAHNLLLSIVLSILAACTMANGILVAPVLVVAALLMQLKLRDVAALALVAAVTCGLYLHGYQRVAAHAELPLAISSLPKWGTFFFAYLGGAAPNALNAAIGLGPSKILIIMLVGMAGCLIAAIVLLQAVRERQRAPYIVAAAGILAFVMGTAAITAIGRAGLDVGGALGNRYGGATAAFWVVISAWGLSLKAPILRHGAEATVFALALIIASAQMAFMGAGLEFSFRKREAGAALMAQVNAPEILRAAHPGPEYIAARAPSLRAAHLSLFAQPWSRLVGELAPPAQQACLGGFAGAAQVIPSEGGATRLSVYGSMARGVRAVAFVGPDNRIVGLAIRRMRDDPRLPWPFNKSRAAPVWSGFAALPVSSMIHAIGVDEQGRGVCAVKGNILAGG